MQPQQMGQRGSLDSQKNLMISAIACDLDEVQLQFHNITNLNYRYNDQKYGAINSSIMNRKDTNEYLSVSYYELEILYQIGSYRFGDIFKCCWRGKINLSNMYYLL